MQRFFFVSYLMPNKTTHQGKTLCRTEEEKEKEKENSFFSEC